MKGFLAACALLLSFLAAFAAPPHHVVMRHSAPPARITASADTIMIPMDFSAGRPTVRVHLNDQGPYPFVFDTGAPSTLVDSALVETAGIQATGEVRVGDPSMKNTRTAKLARVDSLRTGGATLHNLDVTVTPLRDRFESRFLGVLGFPHFAEYLIEMDYPRNRIRLFRGALRGSDAGVVPYRTPHSLIEFDLEVAGRTVAFHLDSGSSGGFTVPESLAKTLPWASPPESTRVAKSISNEFVVYAGILNGHVRFAGLDYENPRVAHMGVMRKGNLGQQVLEDLVVTIDQKNRLLSFRRP